MAQLAIYLDEKTAREVKKASRKSGLSRSQWVSHVLQKELRKGFSEEFFRVLGTWEDKRTPEAIFEDIRRESHQPERPPIR